MQAELSPWLEPIAPVAGIHLAALLRQGLSEDVVIAKARTASIGPYGISGFYAGRRAKQGLMFGHGDISVSAIHASMSRLKSVLASLSA